MKRILISAPSSRSGKTVISTGLMAALNKRGMKVQPFKTGPDFIDTGYHTAACGRTSRNLDAWMLTESYVIDSFAHACKTADIAVIEGVMGLFDGISGTSNEGSTAQIAKWLNAPVVIVVDAGGMSRSVAAIISGFENFDKDVNLAGVIFNRVGSERHRKLLRDALTSACKAEPLGFIPVDRSLNMPSRHLGLLTADEIASADFISQLGDTVEQYVDMEGLLRVADVRAMDAVKTSHGSTGRSDEGSHHVSLTKETETVRIGVALDQSFLFYYEDNFDILRKFGAELCFFSPLKDKGIPEGVGGLYIGGGYPEIHAAGLSKNGSMRDSIRDFAGRGGVIYAECGGLMYLTGGITDFEGCFHAMAGVFPLRASMLNKKRSLGYIKIETVENCILAAKGSTIRGHEFHYSILEEPVDSADMVFTLTKAGTGEVSKEGYSYKNVLGTYAHLHFGSDEQWAHHFVKASREYASRTSY